jgi:glucose-6-phosphate 1-dehydrogenase
MLDKKTPIAPTMQVVESPPRHRARPADPCAIVIFGAGGDLTKRLESLIDSFV